MSILNQAKVVVSSADILALHATPKLLIPAQGAGKVIFPLWRAARYSFLTAAYALSGDGNYAETRFDGVGSVLDNQGIDSISSVLGFIDGATQDALRVLKLFTFGPNVDGLLCENKDVILTQDPASSYITGDGEITIWHWYTVLDV